MSKNFCVYKHTSPNGKCYIGITSRNPLLRWGKDGYNYLKRNKDGYMHKYFACAINKYGWDNIKHEILFCNLSKELACNIEQVYIKYFKSINKSYNLTNGGEGVLGYILTKEQKERLSNSHKGIKQSIETIEKRKFKNKGKKRTIQQIINQKIAKPVLQYSKQGEFIAEYYSTAEAARQTGINGGHIGCCCNGRLNRKTCGGFIWKWKNDSTDVKPIKSLRIIKQYSLDGNLLAIFENIYEAIEKTGVSKSRIYNCLSGRTKSPRQYIWKY